MTIAPTEIKRGTTFPVMEVFGPTIQGEGILAGMPTYFVRFGGCDYRCSWCDSMHAVLPKEVKAHAVRMTACEVVDGVLGLAAGAEWVTFSGGNPALLELGELTREFQKATIRVTVETQGSKWRDWLATVNCLTISPKPPSSGMAEKVERDLPGFMYAASLARPRRTRDALKIVVFDQDDLDFAATTFRLYPTWPRFVSCGTVPGEPLEELAERYRWLCEAVSTDRLTRFRQVRALPQLHVVAWGHVKGV